MQIVTVVVSEQGFDQNGCYKVKGLGVGDVNVTLAQVVFKLGEGLDEAKISHGPNLERSVNLKRDGNVEARAPLVARTELRLDYIRLSGQDSTIAATGTTSGTIEVSGNPLP